MPRIDVIAAGRLKPGPLLDLWQEYSERMTWPLTLYEIEGRNAAEEHKKLEAKIVSGAFICILDETGQSLSSRAFAKKLDDAAAQGRTQQQFLIGGAEGLSTEIRQRADLLLSFGKQTWPHMLARVMLIEQIYRAEKILAGHPYHRD